MLRTVIDQLSNAHPQPRLSVYNYFVPCKLRLRLGLRQTLWFPNYTRLSGLVGYPILERYRETLGLTLPREIDWVFDLSGFCYTDHWGAENAVNMRRYLSRQRDFDTKYVIFPQAFGPFEEPQLATAFTDVANEAVLLCVRDDRSREYLEGLRIETPVMKAPDLTTIAPANVPSWCAEESPYTCVVPNSRMVEEKSGADQASYVNFLSRVCERLGQEGEKILFLLFEPGDRALLTAVRDALGREALYLEEDDPVRLRGVIGEARAVVASRYHALVSALSQGVFALGTSWTHKYEGLFQDYDCTDLLLSDISDERDVREHVDLLVDTSARNTYAKRISARAEEMKDRAVEMWARIGDVTGLEGVDQLEEKSDGNAPKKFDPSGS